MKKKIVYIAHPISGKIQENVNKILAIVKELNMSRKDIVPFAPYVVDVLAMDDTDPEERQRGIDNDIALFESGMIDEVYLYGDKISAGMRAEVKLAFELGIPITAMRFGLIKELSSIIYDMVKASNIEPKPDDNFGLNVLSTDKFFKA